MGEGADGLLPVQVVALPVQLKAFAHPTRVRLLEMLIEQPMTVKQLGDAMGMSAARAHYHLKFLERGGLVRLVERREKAGVVEKYYRAASRKYIVGSSPGVFGEPGAVILEALSAAMLSGAIAAVSGAPIGLVAAANERVTVPAHEVVRLLGVANTLQAGHEELRALHAPGDSGGINFELTYALYAAGNRPANTGAGASAGQGVGRGVKSGLRRDGGNADAADAEQGADDQPGGHRESESGAGC